MVTRLCFVAGRLARLILPSARLTGGLLDRLCSGHVVPGLGRYATILSLARLVGPRLTSSLGGGTLFSYEVSRIRIYAGCRTNIGLVCSQWARRVIRLPRSCDIVPISSVEATHLSRAWLVCPPLTRGRASGLGGVHVVTLLCVGAFRHAICRLICSSRAWGLATSTRCRRLDVESGFGV